LFSKVMIVMRLIWNSSALKRLSSSPTSSEKVIRPKVMEKILRSMILQEPSTHILSIGRKIVLPIMLTVFKRVCFQPLTIRTSGHKPLCKLRLVHGLVVILIPKVPVTGLVVKLIGAVDMYHMT